MKVKLWIEKQNNDLFHISQNLVEWSGDKDKAE